MAARPHGADEPEAVEPDSARHSPARPGPDGAEEPVVPGDEPASPADGPPSADDEPVDSAAEDLGRAGEDLSGAGERPSADVEGSEPPAGREDHGEPLPGDDEDLLSSDVEARWLEIVEQLTTADPTADPAPRASRRRDDPAAVEPTPEAGTPPGGYARIVRGVDPERFRAWTPDPDVEEAEDHFEPPDPGPVLSGDPLLTLAWTAVVGVPLLLLFSVVAWRDIPTWLLEGAGVAFLCGVALLVWRMPKDRDDTSGPGAVV
ncbi:MAG TPA: hypothetical protein VGK35_07475 [Actinotalea sp.]|jgi:hypothetical protein